MLKAVLADVVHFRVPRAVAFERLAELEALTTTYGGIAVVRTIQRRAVPDQRTFLGKGKVEEILTHAKEWGVNLLVVNALLKPRQVYALEEVLRPAGVKVWDRIDLILHIFAKHATSAEAKLEIELARLRHMGPRIYNLGMQLGRQRGGTSTRGGSGEGNTEAMKRHLREQEHALLEKLKARETLRAEQRKHRERRGQQTAALVGYTNAGKTSLLNALTKRHEYAADKLFATLDTRVGECFLPSLQTSVLISDTIGFIDALPPELLKAFTATLSEALHADVLLHVVDVSDPKARDKVRIVQDILQTLGINDKLQILVGNKQDLIKKGKKDAVMKAIRPDVLVSAFTKEGIDQLRMRIGELLSPVTSKEYRLQAEK